MISHIIKKLPWKKLSILLVLVCLLVGWVAYRQTRQEYPEIAKLVGKEFTFGELSVFFTKLSQTKGPVYAYEVLKVAPLPKNTDMHLLGHVVGDELYKLEGIQGMHRCTQDFRNACSHSIVVGYFLEKGENGLGDIAQACRQAPGGSGAYTMCFHGLGHGILAAVDYDMPRTVSLCQKTGTAQYMFRESSECVGGAVMEIISGGFHNKSLWEVATKKYLSTTEPLLPCTADYMPSTSRSMCLEYITPHLITAAGGSLDVGIPDADTLRRSFAFCDQLERESDRLVCYKGFGKEFIVLAHNRDIRTLSKITDEEIQIVISTCAHAGNTEGELGCLTHALDSLYWGGENDPKASIHYCQLMQTDTLKSRCFGHLVGAMQFYVKDPKRRETFCRMMPKDYADHCEG